MKPTLLCGDALEVLRDLEPASVQCVVTSPPYWGLRSYDANAVRIDPGLSPKQRAWLLAEMEKRGIRARV